MRYAWAFTFFVGRRWCYLQRLRLGLNRRNIGIDQVIQQAGLLRIHLLIALGKLKRLSCAISWVSFSITV